MRNVITTVIVSLVSSLSIFRAGIAVDAFSMSMSTSNGNKSISVSKSKSTSLSAPTSASTSTSTPTLTTTNTKNMNMMNRRTVFTTILQSTTAASILTFGPSNNTKANAIAIPEQKSYSSNARNMDRLSSGDSSGGSLYNNSPDTVVASKRRAMVGCKVTPSRVEASRIENEVNSNGNDSGGKSGFGFLNNGVISEKDCNMRVMGGDSEFMLKAMRNLDCPTCPYGIEGA